MLCQLIVLLSDMLFRSVFVFIVLVCSTTLWIGQLDKKTQQQDIMSLMEEFGQIESINVSIDQSCKCTSLFKILGSEWFFLLFTQNA